MRQTLRTGGDAFRRQVLWYLKTWSKEDGSGWGAQALVLLRDVWPRERAVRTEETSEYLFDLAIDADRDRFTFLVDAVTPLMTTIRSDALGVIELTRAGDEELVHEPMALLKLLYVALAESATDWPYHADTVVERLAANPATATRSENGRAPPTACSAVNGPSECRQWGRDAPILPKVTSARFGSKPPVLRQGQEGPEIVIVKGFRTPASHWREGVHGGRRPKSLEGGNRGGSLRRRWCRAMGI